MSSTKSIISSIKSFDSEISNTSYVNKILKINRKLSENSMLNHYIKLETELHTEDTDDFLVYHSRLNDKYFEVDFNKSSCLVDDSDNEEN